MFAYVKAMFSRYRDDGALRLLDEPEAASDHPLVQIATADRSLEETRA
jgi:hypothetical protein